MGMTVKPPPQALMLFMMVHAARIVSEMRIARTAIIAPSRKGDVMPPVFVVLDQRFVRRSSIRFVAVMGKPMAMRVKLLPQVRMSLRRGPVIRLRLVTTHNPARGIIIASVRIVPVKVQVFVVFEPSSVPKYSIRSAVVMA